MSDTHDIPGSRCLECGHLIEQATDPTFSGQKPEPGSWMVCCYCGYVAILTENTTMRRPTPVEIVLMKSRPEFMQEIKRVRRAIRQLHQRN